MFETIANIVAQQFDLDRDTLTPETSFVDDIGCDSLDIVELIMTMEDEFGLSEIPENELKELTTVGKLAEYVEKVTDK